MSGYRVKRSITAAALLCAAAGVVAACGGGDDSPRPRPSSPTGGAGAGSAGGGGEGGGGGATPGTCGDGVADPEEACDGDDLKSASCQSLGFEGGELRCSPSCTADASSCSSPEACQDGQDNDLDGSADCGDPECADACADMCAEPVPLADPATATGDTSGHAVVSSGCMTSSPGVAYTFTAASTGLLDVVLTPQTDARLVATLRGACADASTMIACGSVSAGAGIDNRLTLPVNEGDAFHIVVTGTDEGQTGAFTLSVTSRQTVCGDSIQDSTEECDNPVDETDDGCDEECRLEATEVEPNDTLAAANTYAAPFFAAIDPRADQDLVRVTVPSGPTVLIAETTDVTSDDCLNNRLDSVIEILDDSGATIVRRDRGETGLCARAVAPSLAAGDYYVRVTAATGAARTTFPYRLDVTLVEEACGDGNLTEGEQCDDGNTDALDGCSPTCRFELDETEPNSTPAQANAYTSPWLAEIAPAGDVDVIAVQVPGSSSTLHVNVADNGTDACANGLLDSYIEILGDDGATVLASDDDGGIGYCSYASVTDLAAGTYHVRVRAADLVPNATFFYRLNVTVL
ncbi:pre-peptidase C-terminal domain-containing protein [Sorangium sp. So ce1153]|uniref:pre-peptidase C-terminal domain-containing protein n=1 Tax=Sorangium sp. So ce1153 TaxID=3133333 RepID=UPI003F60DD81